MDNKILEILIDMQKDMKNVQKDIKDIQGDIKTINNRLDKIDFKMKDGFETLEILSENNSIDLNKVKTKVSKLEKRVLEMNIVN